MNVLRNRVLSREATIHGRRPWQRFASSTARTTRVFHNSSSNTSCALLRDERSLFQTTTAVNSVLLPLPSSSSSRFHPVAPAAVSFGRRSFSTNDPTSIAKTSSATTTNSSSATSTPLDTADQVTTAATSSNQDANIISDSKKRVLACALQGDAIQAQEILDQLERLLLLTNHDAITTTTNSQRIDTVLLECREAVLDAWLSHQAFLMKEYDDSLIPPQGDDNDNNTTSSNHDNNNNKKMTRQQQQQQQNNRHLREQIFRAAECAHQALEKTVPFLSRPDIMAIYTQQSIHKQKGRRSSHSTGDNIMNFDDDDDATNVLEDPGGIVLGSSSSSSSKLNIKQSQATILHRCNAVLTAWARASRVTAKRRGIPQRATYLVQRMEASSVPSSSSGGAAATVGVRPTTESYNRVLEAWALSQEHLRATMAEHLFQGMLKKHRKDKQHHAAKPDGRSYRWIIHAWCHSRQKKSAFTATGHLMNFLRRLEKGRDDTIGPTLETYHMVMESWTTAEDKNAPIKAMGILRIMEYAASQSFCSVPVDETCYRYYLLASAKRSVIPEQGPLALQILNKLKYQQIVPDQVCYGAAIRTWKNAALNPLFGDTRELSVTRAVELLEELCVAHNRSSLRFVKPATENFNDVLEALSASYRGVSRGIAETLVTVMESSIQEGEESALSDIRPNARTYQWLLLGHAKSQKKDKLQSATQVLEQMKTNLVAVMEDDKSPEESIVGVYNAFIQVCASQQEKKEEEQTFRSNHDVLQQALQAVEELRSLFGLRPNPETYSNLFDVCKKHLGVGSERSRILEDIFLGCCEEGLVDERVLQSLKRAASEQQYLDLVIAKSDNVEGTRMVPEEWTRNVGGRRVITADGRKAMPLSVDGKYTITRAMKEFKMRKLRSKANQRVLQGGRWRFIKNELVKPNRIQLDEEARL